MNIGIVVCLKSRSERYGLVGGQGVRMILRASRRSAGFLSLSQITTHFVAKVAQIYYSVLSRGHEVVTRDSQPCLGTWLSYLTCCKARVHLPILSGRHVCCPSTSAVFCQPRQLLELCSWSSRSVEAWAKINIFPLITLINHFSFNLWYLIRPTENWL